MSELVTWETCPTCGGAAAVGWLDEAPVEFDCPRHCSLDRVEVRAAFEPRSGLR